MHNVLYVPKITCDLFSVRAAASRGNSVNFGRAKCWIRNSRSTLLGMGSLVGNLYQLDCEPILQDLEHGTLAQEHVSVASGVNCGISVSRNITKSL